MTSLCQMGCNSRYHTTNTHEFKRKPTPNAMKVIQAAYIGWRNHRNGPPAHSRLFDHHFFRVINVHTWSAAPVVIRIAAATFVTPEWIVMVRWPRTRSTHQAIAKSTRLIIAPDGPTPNTFLYLLIFMRSRNRAMWSWIGFDEYYPDTPFSGEGPVQLLKQGHCLFAFVGVRYRSPTGLTES